MPNIVDAGNLVRSEKRFRRTPTHRATLGIAAFSPTYGNGGRVHTGHCIIGGMPRSPIDPAAQGTASRGRAYTYVLPCRDEAMLKLGFSRDPLQRMQALHERYFDYFDLEQGFLLETDAVRDARRLERELAASIAEHSAPAPLVVREEAAGLTEWYRGAYAALRERALALARDEGYTLHAPLQAWTAQALAARADKLFSWADRVLDALPYVPPGEHLGAEAANLARNLRNAIDAYLAVGIDPRAWLSAPAWRWCFAAPRPEHRAMLLRDDPEGEAYAARDAALVVGKARPHCTVYARSDDARATRVFLEQNLPDPSTRFTVEKEELPGKPDHASVAYRIKQAGKPYATWVFGSHRGAGPFNVAITLKMER